jgi:serine/threonine-protein kinase
LEIGKEEFSEDVGEGKIISSSPAGGGRVDPNGVVTVTVSKGKERFIIPDLKGLKPEVAQGLIEENKLVVAEIVEEFSSEIGKGLILRTSPVSGERVKRETSLTLYVSKGVEQLALADYKGKSGEQALNELVEAGFEVDTKYIFSEDLPAGAVVSQTPGSGEADKGSRVILIVSKGTEFVFVPNLFALSEAKAVAALEDLELKASVKKVGTKKNKVVTNVVPKVGSKVKRGSTVTITVG